MATAANSPEQNRNIRTQGPKGQTGLFIETNPISQSTPGLLYAASLQPGESTAPHRPLWARPFEYWHLLSLDAPTVAALWAWFFARAMRVELPWHAPLLLALGTWLIYVADRLLDGAHRDPATPLQQRHLFHRKHRRAFLAAALAAASLLLWLIVMRMTASARREDTVLFAAALLYLVLVHKPRAGAANWLPKELAVGIVFAAATAVPAWSRIDGAGRRALLPGVSLFALLCWLNCVAIERWENLGPGALLRSPGTHLSTQWAATHFRAAVSALTAIAGTFAICLGAWSLHSKILSLKFVQQICHPERREGSAFSAMSIEATCARFFQASPTHHASLICLAVVTSTVCLVAIDRCTSRVSVPHLRIAADAALLTPVLFLSFLH